MGFNYGAPSKKNNIQIILRVQNKMRVHSQLVDTPGQQHDDSKLRNSQKSEIYKKKTDEHSNCLAQKVFPAARPTRLKKITNDFINSQS